MHHQNIRNSILSLLLTGTLSFLIACKKAGSTGAEQDRPVAEETAKKQMVPVRFESDQLTISMKYNPNSAELIEISGSDGYTTVITYKDHEPFEFKKTKQQVPYELVDYIKDKDGLLKARVFNQTGTAYIHKSSYTLRYDQDQMLLKVSYVSNSNVPVKDLSFTYRSGNAETQIIQEYPGQPKTIDLAYDTKNAVFKHLKYAERLFLESRYPFFNAGVHNLLKSSEAGQIITSYDYQYNDNDYPSEITVPSGAKKQTFKIIYTELKP